MARIRTIKPGFFTHDVVGELPQGTRLLFLGLLCLADREGRLSDRPKRIRVEVLPYDDCDVNAMLNELSEAGLVIRYQGNGERYLQIVNFTKHQVIHPKESPSTIPAPGASPEMPRQATASPEITGQDTDQPGRKGREGKEISGREGGERASAQSPPPLPAAQELIPVLAEPVKPKPEPARGSSRPQSRDPSPAPDLEPWKCAVEEITELKRSAGMRVSDWITEQAIALREQGFSPPEAVSVAQKSGRVDFKLNYLAVDLVSERKKQTNGKSNSHQRPPEPNSKPIAFRANKRIV